MKTRLLLVLSVSVLLSSCSPVKLPITNAYQLSTYSSKEFVATPRVLTLLVTPPEAVAGYQTEAMLYIKKPFQVEAFAKNAWTSPPAEMLQPLMVQSLQKTGYFTAVTPSAYSVEADYRLDTQLLILEQNFLKKPSVLEFSARVVLTQVVTNRVLASKTMSLSIACSADTPYGGVLAANQAVQQFTGMVSAFVVSAFRRKL